MILGIDEVGRGPWAGPLVVGAVVLGEAVIEGLTDSKKLTKKKREVLNEVIREKASGFGLGWVDASEIDEIGLAAALRLATIRAVEQVGAPYHEIIIDGTINFLKETSKGCYVTTLPKADLLIPSVSAASIIAKVARDNYMALQDEVYPGYGFTSHVGYGTAMHRLSIDRLGVTPLHRLSFAPLAKYKQSESIESQNKSTKQIGDEAETVVENYLLGLGHEVLERNWKTKFCKIDIISKKDSTIFFTEVKYRKTSLRDDGLAALTRKKQQMSFAASYYEATKDVQGYDLRLAAASLTGTPPVIESYLQFV